MAASQPRGHPGRLIFGFLNRPARLTAVPAADAFGSDTQNRHHDDQTERREDHRGDAQKLTDAELDHHFG